jgi:hypothetical protein
MQIYSELTQDSTQPIRQRHVTNANGSDLLDSTLVTVSAALDNLYKQASRPLLVPGFLR